MPVARRVEDAKRLLIHAGLDGQGERRGWRATGTAAVHRGSYGTRLGFGGNGVDAEAAASTTTQRHLFEP